MRISYASLCKCVSILLEKEIYVVVADENNKIKKCELSKILVNQTILLQRISHITVSSQSITNDIIIICPLPF